MYISIYRDTHINRFLADYPSVHRLLVGVIGTLLAMRSSLLQARVEIFERLEPLLKVTAYVLLNLRGIVFQRCRARERLDDWGHEVIVLGNPEKRVIFHSGKLPQPTRR